MTVLALTSTRGAPGVTTTALALALAWPRAVLLVEADVSGSSSIKAGHLRGQAGPEPNIVDLAVAYRNNALNLTSLRASTIELPLDSSRAVLPGLVSAAQRISLTQDFWIALGALLVGLPNHGIDVIIDAGRRGMRSGPDPLLERADLFIAVSRTRLDDVVSVAANAADLRGPTDVAVDRVGTVLVGEGQPHSAPAVGRATGIPVWSTIAWDPVNAERLSGGKEINSRQRFDKSPLMRSARTAVDDLSRIYQRRQHVVAPPMGGRVHG
ncbi:hypothetical protein [Phytoactinopolyspora mesophila]|uniref:ParA family protein n=1 Tax=Phytoactinopolyspora mesophila TaxID=2650750 RepID=A0A7K3MAC7_9ACTN|nr:hypothetical protein [Phytoactinopolyspora mesophila]NDL60216.1 hypothetical protein [Phytoactinopolyspora mesophila]